MPNQKISELTAIVTVDNSVDVLPIVDISANTTKKVTPNALKTALALDNVNNTSDANKPVSIAQQDALNAKVDENAPITPGTAAKITFDAKGLVTSGDSLDETDLPTGINANKIGTGAVSSTEFGYLDGVTSAIQTQIDGKQATLVSGTNIKTINSASLLGSGDVAVQPTLVSGTNIKTINSTSLLGSGDITISANPSGVAGAIQFSNGSAFASDAANLFWDDTNNRLGVGTNAPSATGHFKGNGSTSATNSLLVQNSAGTSALTVQDNLNTILGGSLTLPSFQQIFSGTNDIYFQTFRTVFNATFNTIAGQYAFLFDDGGGNNTVTSGTLGRFAINSRFAPTSGTAVYNTALINPTINQTGSANGITRGLYINPTLTAAADFRAIEASNGGAYINTTSVQASAILQADSTSKGFLPPRMTTTQKNAITAVAGLVVYDSTTNKLQCYNGSTWNDLF
jgi:hypothetical protein